MSIPERLGAVRQRIAQTGRDPESVTIVAVTKGFNVGVCRQALDSGLGILGENRVQEALGKMKAVEGAEWHLIGHLQTNKARLAAGYFALIHSLDSGHLAEALARSRPGQAVLVEVNATREPQRSGVEPEGAAGLIEACQGLVDVRGMMAMGPSSGDPAECFRQVARLLEECRQRTGLALPVLSMGMSGDFEAALAAGSTMLRLGQALFGPRRL